MSSPAIKDDRSGGRWHYQVSRLELTMLLVWIDCRTEAFEIRHSYETTALKRCCREKLPLVQVATTVCEEASLEKRFANK